MRSQFKVRCTAMIITASAAPVLACPVCDTENGTQVRAGVFNDQFGWNLLKVSSPFPVLLGAVGLLYCLTPASREDGGDHGRT